MGSFCVFSIISAGNVVGYGLMKKGRKNLLNDNLVSFSFQNCIIASIYDRTVLALLIDPHPIDRSINQSINRYSVGSV